MAEALTFFIRRLLRRAAWLGWMTPLAAAMSRRFTARRTSLVVVLGADRVSVARLDARLQLALDGLVALGPLGVGEVALLLALDVGHGDPFDGCFGGVVRRQKLPEQPIDLPGTAAAGHARPR